MLNADKDEFLKALGDNFHYYLSIKKENTVYYGYIYPKGYRTAEGKPETRGININGLHLYLEIVMNDDGVNNKGYTMSVIKENLREKLNEAAEKSRNISVVLTDMGYLYTDCCIVFADGKAKYYYCYSLNIPYDGLRDDTPAIIKDMIVNYTDSNYMNFYHGNTKIQKLFSYNNIMLMFRTCRYYGK